MFVNFVFTNLSFDPCTYMILSTLRLLLTAVGPDNNHAGIWEYILSYRNDGIQLLHSSYMCLCWSGLPTIQRTRFKTTNKGMFFSCILHYLLLTYRANHIFSDIFYYLYKSLFSIFKTNCLMNSTGEKSMNMTGLVVTLKLVGNNSEILNLFQISKPDENPSTIKLLCWYDI